MRLSTYETDQTRTIQSAEYLSSNTCTDCNKTFKTLSSYKAHRSKFHKDILKAGVAKGRPVYQNGLQSQPLVIESNIDPLIEQQRLDDLILKQGMEIMSKNLS